MEGPRRGAGLISAGLSPDDREQGAAAPPADLPRERCPECGTREHLDQWQDAAASGWQCLRPDCQSYGVYGEYE
ncbi:hypothetical protein [Kitasatospora purpeofusca]|uniref:hypothetical protein n=1 Tax=Kitasatospora purpeofusca TaxID=67352 RepID=UPI003680270F